MTIELGPADLHDIAALMRLAQAQCEWKFLSLALAGDRRTKDAKIVDNAMQGAITYAEMFQRWYRQAAKEAAK